jgi:ABC-type uncharacterized transport system permease subunit
MQKLHYQHMHTYTSFGCKLKVVGTVTSADDEAGKNATATATAAAC